MAELVAQFEFEDVSKINSKESSSKLEEYFVETLEKGVEVINKKDYEDYDYEKKDSHDTFSRFWEKKPELRD